MIEDTWVQCHKDSEEDPRGRGEGKVRAAAQGREGATPQKLARPNRGAAYGYLHLCTSCLQ